MVSKPKGVDTVPQTVYADLYFLVNFSMDLLCLMITASLLHRRPARWRAILAAALGGAYALVALLFSFSGAFGLLLDILVGGLLCLVTFKDRQTSLPRVLGCVPVLLLCSILLGGFMTVLYSFLNRLDLPLEALSGDSLSVWIFALVGALAGAATLRGGRLMGLSGKTRSVTVSATLYGKNVTLRALVDSGNLLRDPVSGRSVVVVDVDRLRGVLPPTLLRACTSACPADVLALPEFARAVRPIPTATATGSSLLLAISPDALTVTDGKHTFSADYLLAPAPLGNSAGGFDAIIALS